MRIAVSSGDAGGYEGLRGRHCQLSAAQQRSGSRQAAAVPASPQKYLQLCGSEQSCRAWVLASTGQTNTDMCVCETANQAYGRFKETCVVSTESLGRGARRQAQMPAEVAMGEAQLAH